jgi:hypothetical protein
MAWILLPEVVEQLTDRWEMIRWAFLGDVADDRHRQKALEALQRHVARSLEQILTAPVDQLLWRTVRGIVPAVG